MSLKLYNYKIIKCIQVTSYFDCVMNATASKMKDANIVRDVFIWSKTKEKNYCKL